MPASQGMAQCRYPSVISANSSFLSWDGGPLIGKITSKGRQPLWAFSLHEILPPLLMQGFSAVLHQSRCRKIIPLSQILNRNWVNVVWQIYITSQNFTKKTLRWFTALLKMEQLKVQTLMYQYCWKRPDTIDPLLPEEITKSVNFFSYSQCYPGAIDSNLLINSIKKVISCNY